MSDLSPPTSAARPAPAVLTRAQFLGWAGLVGVGYFVLSVVALHVAQASSMPWHMSEFAHSQLPWLWETAAYGMALGGLALTLAVALLLPGTWSARLGVLFLGLATFGALLIATFPVDQGTQNTTLAGTIHNDAVRPTFLLLAGAMLVLAPAFRRSLVWRPLSETSFTLGILTSLACVAYAFTDETGVVWVAIVQRILVGMAAAWFLLLAFRLLDGRLLLPARAAPSAEPTPAPGENQE
jgi:hypothetical protein